MDLNRNTNDHFRNLEYLFVTLAKSSDEKLKLNCLRETSRQRKKNLQVREFNRVAKIFIVIKIDKILTENFQPCQNVVEMT